MVSILVL
jgi:hypothetical protein